MKPFYLITIYLLLALNPVFSQKDSSLTFLSSKGSFCYPVNDIFKIHEQKEYGELTVPSITFFSKSSSYVHAVFDGEVDFVLKVDDAYVVSVKYGPYSIIYQNLFICNFEKGALVKKGAVLGLEAQDFDGNFSTTVSISKKGEFFAPGKWFTQKSCL